MTKNNSGSSSRETFYPKEENLGLNCHFWGTIGALECVFPKAELEGRVACEGLIDDVCLFLKNGREPISLSWDQRVEIRTRAPDRLANHDLPPGEIF